MRGGGVPAEDLGVDPARTGSRARLPGRSSLLHAVLARGPGVAFRRLRFGAGAAHPRPQDSARLGAAFPRLAYSRTVARRARPAAALWRQAGGIPAGARIRA